MFKFRYTLPLLLCLFLTGCAPVLLLSGAAAGIGGYKYYKGLLTVVYEAPYENTWDASIKALEDLEFTIQEKTEKIGSGKISAASSSKDQEANLFLEYVSPHETQVSIRVGLLGDENASNVIKDKIGSILFEK
jgi:uncharacterized lipoprotein